MIVSKLDSVTTYMDDANYWAPLFIDDNEDDDHGDNEDQQNSTCASATNTDNHRRGLIRWMIRARLAQKNVKYGNERNTASVVIDSGTTLHFVQSSDNLPYLGQSQRWSNYPMEAQFRQPTWCASHLTLLMRRQGKHTCYLISKGTHCSASQFWQRMDTPRFSMPETKG